MHFNLSLALPYEQAQDLKDLTDSLRQIFSSRCKDPSQAAVRKITYTNVLRAVFAHALDHMTHDERVKLIDTVMADGVVNGRPRSAA